MNLYIFNDINNDSVIKSLLDFKQSHNRQSYFEAARGLIKFSRTRSVTSDTIKEYVIQEILHLENIPTLDEIEEFARYDIEKLCNELLFYDWDKLFKQEGRMPLSHIIPESEVYAGVSSYVSSLKTLVSITDEKEMEEAVLKHCDKFGTGSMSAYSAMKWTGTTFRGVLSTDPITFDSLTGLGSQKKVLIANTKAFVEGKPANNVLLVGNSGTGKSSSVKACLNMFKDDGLRLIEVGKDSIGDLPVIMSSINDRKRKYIIFIDDLSFEPEDHSYKQLKVALDGQLEKSADNILIYATSNRRHLVRETWSDRSAEATEDIHKNDTVNEKMSLSTRFGITLHFMAPNQYEYMEMVDDMLKRHGIEPTDEIRNKALTWAVNYNGRSGRTAKQFITNYLSSINE